MALIYGILLWPLVGLFARRLLGSPHRWRWLGWGWRGGVVAGSLLASANLTGAMVARGRDGHRHQRRAGARR